MPGTDRSITPVCVEYWLFLMLPAQRNKRHVQTQGETLDHKITAIERMHNVLFHVVDFSK